MEENIFNWGEGMKLILNFSEWERFHDSCFSYYECSTCPFHAKTGDCMVCEFSNNPHFEIILEEDLENDLKEYLKETQNKTEKEP